MVSIFWDGPALLFIDYLEKSRTISSDHYTLKLMCVKDEIVTKLFEEEQCTGVTGLWLNCFCTQRIRRKMLQGKRFESTEEVMADTGDYFLAKDNSFYNKGMELQVKHCVNCTAFEGNYVDE